MLARQVLAVVTCGLALGMASWRADSQPQVAILGDGENEQPFDPSTHSNAGYPGTKVLLRLAGNEQVEEFPMVTLARLEKQVNQAGQEDRLFDTEQEAACEHNTGKFKEAQKQASMVVKQGGEVLEQCHAQKVLAKASWRASREEERQQSKEADTTREEKHKVAVDFGVRSADNQQGLDLLLQAGHALCLMLRAERVPPDLCATLNEEEIFPVSAADLDGLVATNASLKQHQAESEKYEETKLAEWAPLATAAVEVGKADPDENGFPKLRLGEPGPDAHQTSRQLEKMITRAAQLQKPMLSEALESVLLSIKQGVFSGRRGAKKAEGVIGLVMRIRKQISDAYREDRREYSKDLEKINQRSRLIFEQLATQSDKQSRIGYQLAEIENRTVKAVDLLDWGSQKLTEAAKALHDESKRCAGVQERVRLRNAERRQVRVRIQEVREQITLKPTEAPYCPGGCSTNSTPPRGTCVANQDSKPASCLCELGHYGKHCEKIMCPGFGGGKFLAEMHGACHGGQCDSSRGVCASCPVGQYSGALKACELKKCPSVDCSGHGQCDTSQGKCNCDYGWTGDKCLDKTCLGPEGKRFPAHSHNSCHGRGSCDAATGGCSCKTPYLGEGCQDAGCLNDCTGHGQCDLKRGKCVCDPGRTGPACELKICPNDCSGHGACNRLSGWCSCERGYTGEACRLSTGCDKVTVDWWTRFDRQGWGLCPAGTLMQALYRNSCEGLACIEMAQCVKPCAGDVPIALPDGEEGAGETGRCYHHSWHDSFDHRGWSRCHEGYYLAGIFRSESDALYGIQQAKCCAIHGNTWDKCTEADWSVSWKKKGWSAVPRNLFMTGFFRNATQHVLSSITKASGCGFTTVL